MTLLHVMATQRRLKTKRLMSILLRAVRKESLKAVRFQVISWTLLPLLALHLIKISRRITCLTFTDSWTRTTTLSCPAPSQVANSCESIVLTTLVSLTMQHHLLEIWTKLSSWIWMSMAPRWQRLPKNWLTVSLLLKKQISRRSCTL